MKEKPQDKIHAFCTVDPKYVEKVGDQIICRKCSREMANLDEPAAATSGTRSRQLLCGVISAAALSACNTTDKPDFDEPFIYGRVKPPQEDVPMLGLPALPNPETSSDAEQDYPHAKPIEGETGKVESPYGGHQVDISRIPPGSFVIDPKYGAESDKIFRI